MPSLVPPAIHPILVHLPLVMVPVAAVLVTLRRRVPWAQQAAPLALALGAAGALAAAAAGIAEHEPWEEELEGTPAEAWLDVHKALGLVTTGALLLAAGTMAWMRRAPFAGRRGTLWAAALWALTLLLAWTAWWGGAIVHET